MKTLLIVESPNKSAAVAALAAPALKGTVQVWACLGHLRDLPAETLGVDLAGGFRPAYAVTARRTETVAALRKKIQAADRVLLATDPDREGEAIAWHITEVCAAELQGKKVARASFTSITAAVVQQAVRRPRKLDERLTQAAVARRVLDRLVGYFVSPRLQTAALKKLSGGQGLSAGRVQTAALRLLVEHDRQAAVRLPDTWTVEAEF